MAVANYSLCYRPLQGGVSILNPLVAKVGTLGFIATADGLDRWIVSCYHVLGRIDLSVFTDGEPIYQPIDDVENLVARVSIGRANTQLDCAAARVEPGILTSNEIIGLPTMRGVSEPQIGMRVMKSGCITGVTEGVICAVDGDKIEIGLPPNFPPRYEMAQEGDSGALWISKEDGSAVALHRAGNAYGGKICFGVKIKAILDQLKLGFI